MLFLFFFFFFFFFNDTATTEIYTLSLHDALPIWTVAPLDSDNSLSRGRLLLGPKRVAEDIQADGAAPAIEPDLDDVEPAGALAEPPPAAVRRRERRQGALLSRAHRFGRRSVGLGPAGFDFHKHEIP